VKATPAADRIPSLSLFPIATGGFLALTLLKFGNPVVLDHKLVVPSTFWDLVVAAWPLAWAYPLVTALCLWGLWIGLRSPAQQGGCGPGKLTRALVGLPLGWFLWQCLSAAQTVHGPLTRVTLLYFAGAVACFYLGYFVLPRVPDLALMWLLALFGLVAVIGSGFDQHFGGLEATRRFIQSQPDWQNQSPEFLKKIASNRIFSTLFYPNTLAGALLLFLPPAIATALTFPARRCLGWILACLIAAGGLACLYWSGSKAGWLIAMLLALMAWVQTNKVRKLACLFVPLGLGVGLAGFYLKHSAYFEGGAKSVGARLDYWNVALKIAVDHPVFGTGPGTFSVLYRYMKPPDAEMTRLVHNDYLEQASDSGAIGFVLYVTFLLSSILSLRPAHPVGEIGPSGPLNRMPFSIHLAVWLGVVGWAAQSLAEFALYVPALGWSAFLFLGWLWGVKAGRIPSTNQTLPDNLHGR
jgi:O-antigen ligase